MPIQWPLGPESDMTVKVTGTSTILKSSDPCDVNITWTVPAPYDWMLAGKFLLRAYVESLGPGPEMQVGADASVDVVPSQRDYTQTINILGGTLLGEGELDGGGVPVSGVYKIIVVLQHQWPGSTVTVISGFAEDMLRMFRSP